jgi:5-methylcytosine-specific restriction endonuclease McrBC regulatory subunit McrC
MSAAGPVTVVAERATLSVSRLFYQQLSDSERMSQLMQAGVLGLLRSKEVPYGIRASCYVGHAVLEDGMRLEVREKSTGALAALLRWSLPADLRPAPVPSHVGVSVPILEVFARRFLALLGYYVRHGRVKAYLPYIRKSETPRGRIHVPETLRLLSRGQRGKIACRQQVLSADILVNRLLRLGIETIEQLFSSDQQAQDALAEARMYAPLFQDAQTWELQRRGDGFRVDAFAQALDNTRMTDDLFGALAYARALVLHLGIWPQSESDPTVPHSFFLNLETLFEDAVRQVSSEILTSNTVMKGARVNRPLFAQMPGRYVAAPDVVVQAETSVVLVADCKYKQMSGFPDHSDVYQLFSHCSALQCELGVLIYPGERFGCVPLGKTASGISMHSASVRIANLWEDLNRLFIDTLPKVDEGSIAIYASPEAAS